MGWLNVTAFLMAVCGIALGFGMSGGNVVDGKVLRHRDATNIEFARLTRSLNGVSHLSVGELTDGQAWIMLEGYDGSSVVARATSTEIAAMYHDAKTKFAYHEPVSKYGVSSLPSSVLKQPTIPAYADYGALVAFVLLSAAQWVLFYTTLQMDPDGDRYERLKIVNWGWFVLFFASVAAGISFGSTRWIVSHLVALIFIALLSVLNGVLCFWFCSWISSERIRLGISYESIYRQLLPEAMGFYGFMMTIGGGYLLYQCWEAFSRAYV